MNVVAKATQSEEQPHDFRELVDELCFPHSVSERQLLETHISWVILTGKFAYKIKKPVDLGFVDYSTLEKRQYFCQREVELNRRFAPRLYVDVVAIALNGDAFVICNSSDEVDAGKIVDYAVKMRQFPQDAIVASRLDNPDLARHAVEEFGRRIARFHSKIESASPADDLVQPGQVVHDAAENYEVLCCPEIGSSRRRRLEQLQQYSSRLSNDLLDKFRQRVDSGKIKRCHGDLHLKNIIQLDGELIPFDGIEFNEQFQWIDVLSEIAFPVMDFMARGRSDLGWRLLNAYLEATVEYTDLDLLRFYLVHRAMVRAKVAWLNPANHREDRRAEYAPADEPGDLHAGPWDKYLAAAEYFAFQMKPKLSITHGFSGSGKSTFASYVIDVEGGIRIRSDVLRHRIADKLQPTDKYSPDMSDSVYGSLANLVRGGLKTGFPVIADASFLNLDRRRVFWKMAEDLGVRFEIIACDAPINELRERLEHRSNDASEATVAVLEYQLKNRDPLTPEEWKWVRTDSERT